MARKSLLTLRLGVFAVLAVLMVPAFAGGATEDVQPPSDPTPNPDLPIDQDQMYPYCMWLNPWGWPIIRTSCIWPPPVDL